MDDVSTDLGQVRQIHRRIEQLHTIVYFSHLAPSIYRGCGLHGPSGYFASRSAAMGAVPHQLVTATFFNFAPDLVERSLDGVWASTTPKAVLDARLDVVDQTLTEHLGDDILAGAEMHRAAEIARTVAEAACRRSEGRPLFAAHASLEWPDEDHLVLWHAATLLREFRGDAHIAALVTAGLDGIDAIVINAASRQIPANFLRTTRGWPDELWDETVELHRSTGWLALDDGPDGEPTLSENGTAMREEIEIATDRASAAPWLTIDEAHLAELGELIGPWARTLSDAMFARLGR